MRCSKCGWDNKPDAIACTNCYADLSTASDSTNAAPAQPAAPRGVNAQQKPAAGQPTVATPAVAPNSTQYAPQPSGYEGQGMPGFSAQNSSGTGSTAVVPMEIRGWNWGAFFISFWWSIFNRTWLGLLCLVPYVGFVMCIVLGVKGNEWAWMYRKWDNVDHFKRTQRVWAYWGLGLFIVYVVIIIPAILFPVFVKVREAARMQGQSQMQPMPQAPFQTPR